MAGTFSGQPHHGALSMELDFFLPAEPPQEAQQMSRHSGASLLCQLMRQNQFSDPSTSLFLTKPRSDRLMAPARISQKATFLLLICLQQGFKDLCGSICYLSQTYGDMQVPLEAAEQIAGLKMSPCLFQNLFTTNHAGTSCCAVATRSCSGHIILYLLCSGQLIAQERQ